MILQQEIGADQMSKLLTTGKTDLLEGFVSSRTNRKFKAYLARGESGKVSFEFEARPEKPGRKTPSKTPAKTAKTATKTAAKTAVKKAAKKATKTTATKTAAKKAVKKAVKKVAKKATKKATTAVALDE